MAAARRDGCPADALPEPVLGLIFVHCGREHLSDISLVCRCWRRALLAEPALWSKQRLARGSLHDLPLQEQHEWLTSKRRMLAATAPVTTCLEVLRAGGIRSWPPPSGAATGSQLATLLRSLRCACLADVTLACGPVRVRSNDWSQVGECCALDQLCGLPCLPAAALRVLPRFAQLTALSLQSWQLPACTAAVLLQLPQLHSLQCAAREVPASIIDSMCQLTALSRLELRVAVALPPLGGLTQLTELQEMYLYCYNEQLSVAPLPAPAAFPALRRFEAFCSSCTFSEQGNQPLVQVADAVPLTSCKCSVHEDGSSSIELKLRHPLRHPGELQHLLATLLPSGGGPLTSLSLSGDDSWLGEGCLTDMLAALRRCALLRTLRRLDATCWQEEPSWVEAALAALLEQAPALSELTLSGSASLPECVRHRIGLRKLDLNHCQLRELPSGPFLQGLEELTLRGSSLSSLPPALLAATRLRRLAFPATYPRMSVTRADVDGILLRLPQLERVDLTGARLAPATAIHLARAAPHLEILAAGDEHERNI
ncbi:hypothetical protein ABPG75_009348 [Micractinium tetrahymenae]